MRSLNYWLLLHYQIVDVLALVLCEGVELVHGLLSDANGEVDVSVVLGTASASTAAPGVLLLCFHCLLCYKFTTKSLVTNPDADFTLAYHDVEDACELCDVHLLVTELDDLVTFLTIDVSLLYQCSCP